MSEGKPVRLVAKCPECGAIDPFKYTNTCEKCGYKLK